MLEMTEINLLRARSEKDRIAALRNYAIIGSEAEPRFDAITRAAGALFRAPQALLTLVDEDVMWVKSASGTDIRRVPRSDSFCSHTIMGNEVMVVEDAAADPRFSCNPIVTRDGGIRFYAGAPLISPDGFRLGALCVADTVPHEQFSDEQRLALRELADLAMNQIVSRRDEASTQALAGLANSLGEPMLAIDPLGRVAFANRPALEFFGLDVDSIAGRCFDSLVCAGRLGANAAALISIFSESGDGTVSRPFRRSATRADGRETPVGISVSRWDTANGAGLAVVLSDLSTREAADAVASDPRSTSDLGGAPEGALGRLIENLCRDGRSTGLFLLSIDGFEGYCDLLGRNIGHMLLQSVAKRVQTGFPDVAMLARARGNDFAILVDGIDSAESGCKVAEAIHQLLQPAFDLGIRTLDITVSIGFTWGPAPQSMAARLVSDAAFALQGIQRQGGNGLLAYDESLRMRALERQQIQQQLAKALKNQEFVLHYQPQVSLDDGRITGVEALIRWQHPDRGLLQPKDFLGDLEEGSLSQFVGWWTLETACAQLAAWRAMGLDDVGMGVNLFPSQFRSERLVPIVSELLDRFGIDPALLELEVTETIALLNDARGLDSLTRLKAMGVRIAFDDFGTGYASLSSLQQFPLTTLKLDRSFIRNLLKNKNDAVITRSMIGMANGLHLATVAEGVETIEQEDFLKVMGCRVGQGYLYSRPICAADMTHLLRENAHGNARTPRLAAS